LFHSVKGWIERPFFDAQRVIHDLMDARSDPVAVLWTATQDLEHEEIECALQSIGLLHSTQHDLEV